MNYKIIIPIFLLLIILVPTINYFLFDNVEGDPFLAHVVVPAYILDQTHKIETTQAFLINTHFSTNGISIWQVSTANLLQTGFPGSSLLLYSLGSVMGMDFLALGHSQIIFVVYTLIFLILALWVTKRLDLKQNKQVALTFGLLLTAIFMDFIYSLAFNKFLAFQYHAIAWVFYFLIIFLFLEMLQKGFDKRKYVLFFLIFIALLITHYRFPLIIIVNLAMFSFIFYASGRIYKNSGFIQIAKKTVILPVIAFAMTSLTQFYWNMLEVRGNFFDFGFLFDYIRSIITLDNLNTTNAVANTLNYSLAVPWKYVNYIEAAIFISLSLTLIVIALKKGKSKEMKPHEVLFLWAFGSTFFMILAYFMAYHGAIGLGLYEVHFLLLFSPLVAWNHFKKERFHLNKIAKLLVVALSVLAILNAFFGFNYQLTFNSYPIQPVYGAEKSYSFLNQHISGGKIIGSSFSVSADIYQYSAKNKPDMLEQLGFRNIYTEVSIYHATNSFPMFYGNLTKMNDYFLLTNFEVNHGLSSDVIGYNSYLTAQDVCSLKEALDSRENIIYSSGDAFVFSFGG